MGPRSKRTSHYEAAFELWLRQRGIAYVAVNEAKRTLLQSAKLKSFDFVVYRTDATNLIVDVKGRTASAKGGLPNWVTREDIDDLRNWQELFGAGFQAYFVFMYQFPGDPRKAMTKELFHFNDKWYAGYALDAGAYRQHMRARSTSWGTVDLAPEAFSQVAVPLVDIL
ncbi:MAG: HYExAFE family protein [Phycisphaerae bacterium]